MFEADLLNILLTALLGGLGGSLIAVMGRFANRKKEGPRLDQAAAVGFLVGAAFGAFFGIFQSLLVSP